MTVKVSPSRYMRAHGQKPRGTGMWMFTPKEYGEIDFSDESQVFGTSGSTSLSDAAKQAKEWARKHGYREIYVAESKNQDSQIDEGSELKPFKVTYKTKRGESTVKVKARDENEAKAKVRSRPNYQGNAVAIAEGEKFDPDYYPDKDFDEIVKNREKQNAQIRKSQEKNRKKTAEGSNSYGSAFKKADAKRQSAIKKAKAWMKRHNKSAEEAAREFDVSASSLKESQEIMEATPGLDSIGIPKELANKLMKRLNLPHDREPKPIDKLPAVSKLGNEMVIRQTDEGWHAIARVRSGDYNYYLSFRQKDGSNDVEVKKSESIKNVQSIFGKGRGKLWSLKSNGGWAVTSRRSKPASDTDSVDARKGVGQMDGGDIHAYANRVFLPKIKPRIEKAADDIYAQLRSLPRDKDEYGHDKRGWPVRKTAREAALNFAESLEDLAEKGFNHEIMSKFLSMNDMWTSWPAGQRMNAEKLMKEPGARAKFAKVLITQANKIIKRFEDMKANIAKNQGTSESIKMKSKNLNEGVLDDVDDDGFMAKRQLYDLAKYSVELHRMIQDTDELEPWIQAKITKAADYIDTVKHYLEYSGMRDADMSADEFGMGDIADVETELGTIDPEIPTEEVMEYEDEEEGVVYPEDVLRWASNRGIISNEMYDLAMGGGDNGETAAELWRAAEDTADMIGPVDEIGSSDISIWLRDFVEGVKFYGHTLDGANAHLYESKLKAQEIYNKMISELRNKK